MTVRFVFWGANFMYWTRKIRIRWFYHSAQQKIEMWDFEIHVRFWSPFSIKDTLVNTVDCVWFGLCLCVRIAPDALKILPNDPLNPCEHHHGHIDRWITISVFDHLPDWFVASDLRPDRNSGNSQDLHFQNSQKYFCWTRDEYRNNPYQFPDHS